ncbi:MAG: HPF/RaiA family ribosome-associated protein [Nostocaceae cyanobacterium]|nr:HPF/RaiA family ribosome-associated protein [Nostocaceae cyanobacterium]
MPISQQDAYFTTRCLFYKTIKIIPDLCNVRKTSLNIYHTGNYCECRGWLIDLSGGFMILPLQITFRNMSPSEAVEAKIRQYAEKLERFYNHIISCRVIVEAPHQHHRHGNLYHISIDLTVPNGELVINRQSSKRQSHQNIYVAIRDAFDAAKRVLQDYGRRQRQEIKTHDVPPAGHIITLFPDEDYGFILTPSGDEIYFHRNSLFNGDFDQLEVGNEVRFAVEEGNKGLQASTVRMVGKHHLLAENI